MKNFRILFVSAFLVLALSLSLLAVEYTYDHRTHESTATPAVSKLSSIFGDRMAMYLPLDENATDASGHKSPEAKGNLEYTEGYFGKAAKFDNGYITVPGFDPGANSFSFGFWLKTPGNSGDPAIFSNKDWDSGGNPGFILALRAKGNPDMHFNVGPASAERCDLYPQMPLDYADGWVYMILVVDRETETMRYSFDFEPFVEEPLDAGLKDYSFSTDFNVLNIGQDATGQYGDSLIATLDEIVMINGVITEDDMEALAIHYGVKEAPATPETPPVAPETGSALVAVVALATVTGAICVFVSKKTR